MQSSNLVLSAWSYGLAGVAYAVFALHLLQLGYLRAPRDSLKTAMLGAVVCSALWGCLLLGFLLTGNPYLQVFSSLFDLLRYAAWFALLLNLLRAPDSAQLPPGIAWLRPLAIGLVLFGLLALGLMVQGGTVLGDPGRLTLLCAMAMPVLALVLLEQLFRNVAEDLRWNVKPLCLGLAGIFLFDLYLFSQAVLFNSLDRNVLSIRGAVHALVLPLLLLSSSRSSNWTSKVRVSRRAAFHSATLLIAGLYLLFISAVGYYVRYFGGEWGPALQVGLVFAALVVLVVLVLSATVRAKLRVLLGKHFFRYRYDYREEWLKFTKTLSDQKSPQEMGPQVIRGLADMLESPAGALWLRNKGEADFSQLALWNMPEIAAKEDAASAFCKFMTTSGWVVNLEEYRSFPRRYGQLALPDWLRDLKQAWLVVPLSVGEELIGFVVLASARTRMEVNWEVNDLLKTAGRQAASFLAQMQATEALLDARKFDAFNRMSAFVVHDLKNIVTQLSLMMKNAKRLHDNPEFQQDMLMTVENSLDRMRQLMSQLREGASSSGPTAGVDLVEIARRLAASSAQRGRTLELDLQDPVFTRGFEERLERVLGHVVQNAMDATDPSGRVWLKLMRASGQARIEIGDTGHGMSQDFVRNQLFKPFQSTKTTGMGIGAFESFQYVQELGGKIEVDSVVNRGTVVNVLLPLLEVQKASDIHLPKVS
ncbi:MAG: PEP-CTERM system histidine kinase PrsK [Rhodoferax sp.]|nr:PEP-CTERM system histidine kinase PrsK [Rhodoferax sp.]